jgi:hypothetical protein
LGGGWENQTGQALISDQSRDEMQQRTNWGDLLDDGIPASDNNPDN